MSFVDRLLGRKDVQKDHSGFHPVGGSTLGGESSSDSAKMISRRKFLRMAGTFGAGVVGGALVDANRRGERNDGYVAQLASASEQQVQLKPKEQLATTQFNVLIIGDSNTALQNEDETGTTPWTVKLENQLHDTANKLDAPFRISNQADANTVAGAAVKPPEQPPNVYLNSKREQALIQATETLQKQGQKINLVVSMFGTNEIIQSPGDQDVEKAAEEFLSNYMDLVLSVRSLAQPTRFVILAIPPFAKRQGEEFTEAVKRKVWEQVFNQKLAQFAHDMNQQAIVEKQVAGFEATPVSTMEVVFLDPFASIRTTDPEIGTDMNYDGVHILEPYGELVARSVASYIKGLETNGALN